MCNRIKTLSRVVNGSLSICKKCNIYHLEFNNIYIEFNKKELKQFKKYLLTIKIDYWEDKLSCSKLKKKILIPSTQRNLILMFDRQEIKSLKSLFFSQVNDSIELLCIDDIDYTLILN